ncbi:MAG: YCF48-related protein, partial [Ignavibacteria bacterium]|nr:YCF48-related protein [Ignavibacteria bacterium]
TILFTSDHGLTWEIQYEGVTDNLRDIALADSVTAWIVGDNGMILKTTNNGYHWIEQNSGTQIGLNAVYFWDKNNGWAVGDNKKIIRTTDGGTNWTLQSVTDVPNNISFNGVHFVSLNEGWIAGSSGYVLHTTNGGFNWIIQKNSGETVLQVKFYNLTTGFIIGSNGSIYKTTNSGTNWNSIISNTTLGLNDIHFSTSAEYWIVGDNGTILRSSNSGLSWFQENLETYASIHHISEFSGIKFIAGEYGLLAKKNNSDPWNFWNKGMNISINWVSFSDGVNGFGVGQYGRIIKTTDGGKVWNDIYNGITGDSFYGADMSDQNKLWLVGDLGVLLHTSNGGANWIQQSTNTTNTLLSISFVDGNNGWAVGDLGELIHTTNGGVTW